MGIMCQQTASDDAMLQKCLAAIRANHVKRRLEQLREKFDMAEKLEKAVERPLSQCFNKNVRAEVAKMYKKKGVAIGLLHKELELVHNVGELLTGNEVPGRKLAKL